jgi:hypothetical protein
MKRIRILLCSIVLTVCVLALGQTAFAQRLDETWFKLNVSAKGFSVGPDEVISKTSFKATAYLSLEWDEGNSHYDCTLVCETSPGMWASQALDGFIDPEFCTEDYIFLPDSDWTVYAPDGSSIHFYFTALVRSKVNTSNELTGATFFTLGAEVNSGETKDGHPVYGGAKVKGKLIDEEKLPFGA